MKQYIGLDNNIEKDVMKNLNFGDILYSAYYDNGDGCTSTCVYLFRGYVDAPSNSKGVWAKYVEAAYYNKNTNTYIPVVKEHRKEDGTFEEVEDIKVGNISVGMFLNEKEALVAWEKMAKKIYNSAKEAVKNYKEV